MSQHRLLSSVATPTPIVAKKKRRCGEMMGGATAECTAVVCCCPFAVMDMLVLALYKAPKGMCRKAVEKKRKNKSPLKQRQRRNDVVSEGGVKVDLDETVRVGNVETMEGVDLEMFGKFYGTGFWRSDSQRSSGL